MECASTVLLCAHSVNMVLTGFKFVQVQHQAPAERGLAVGLLRLGLDGRLYPGIHRLSRHGPAAAARWYTVALVTGPPW